MGLVYIRASQGGLNVVKHLLKECKDRCDDQRITNIYLYKHLNVTWYNLANGYPLSKKHEKIAIEGIGFLNTRNHSTQLSTLHDTNRNQSAGILFDNKNKQIRIKMVPEKIIQRRYVTKVNFKEGYVFHPILPKIGDHKNTAIADVMKIWMYQRNHSWLGTPPGVNMKKQEYLGPPLPRHISHPKSKSSSSRGSRTHSSRLLVFI
jgi:hypothetical protein